jgi:hypothetical protein
LDGAFIGLGLMLRHGIMPEHRLLDAMQARERQEAHG